jgi:hypothetical protein
MTVSNRMQVAKLFSVCNINSEAEEISTERKLQNFFANFEFDLVALLLCSFLLKGKVTLCIDRTEQMLPCGISANINVIF